MEIWKFKGYKGKKANNTKIEDDFLYYENLDELLEHKDICKDLMEYLFYKVDEYSPDGIGFEYEDEGFKFIIE